ncbi:MAG: hypothetical protein ACR2IT_09470 [Pirellulales bacterium]
MNADDYLTVKQSCQQIGCSLRAFYRIVERLGKDEVLTYILGRPAVAKKKIPMLTEHYFPFGSERRHQMAVECGSAGGKQKKKNAARRKRAT